MNVCFKEELINPFQLGRNFLVHYGHSPYLSKTDFFPKIWKCKPLNVITSNKGRYMMCKSLSQNKPFVSQLSCMDKSEVVRDSLTEMVFPKINISISPYDTAWVAMVPSPNSPKEPCFPVCLNWIMENQNQDGSWNSQNSLFLMKEALSSTLACLIALVRWNIGEKNVRKGIFFIQSNISFAIDVQQPSPIGFNIIFPSMIDHAKQLGLEISVPKDTMDAIFCMCDQELQRGSENKCKSWETYLAYIAEGFGNDQDWDKVMRFQMKNGSLFNSPATTAAALLHVWNSRSLQYLHSALSKHGNAVSAVHPFDTYANLHMIDLLEKLGIAWYFCDHIRQILSETYRNWLQNEEEIHSEIITRALAFRLLRIHGFNVSSDAFAQPEVEFLSVWPTPNLFGIRTALELYRASELKVSQTDNILEKVNHSSKSFLEQALSNCTSKNELLKALVCEVEYTLKFPFYTKLERLVHKKHIEICPMGNFLMLKSGIEFQVDYKHVLSLAVKEFNTCQSIYQYELQLLERWIVESKLNQLKFARQRLTSCYFSAAAMIFPAELSDARISFAKNSVLSTMIDDFFDVECSQEEVASFLELIERWDVNYEKSSYSENVSILFSALYKSTNDLGRRANAFQGYDITKQLLYVWKDMINSMNNEFNWQMGGTSPTMDEYMKNGYVSFALGPIILPTLYFMGPKLPMDIIHEPECHNLFKLLSTSGRLLNDIQSFKRESEQGKLNSVALLISESSGSITKEVAERMLRDTINQSRTELLRLVLLKDGGVIPQECKDLFWKMSRILHFYYARTDGYSSPTEMMDAINAVIFTPLEISLE